MYTQDYVPRKDWEEGKELHMYVGFAVNNSTAETEKNLSSAAAKGPHAVVYTCSASSALRNLHILWVFQACGEIR